MRPNIGDHMPPDCEVPEKVMQQSERLFAYLQEREEFYTDSVPKTDMAILFPKSHQEIYLARELRGALRILCDLHCQFDVVTLAADWSKYKVLVLPDSVKISPEVETRLHEYISNGGKIISSGESGMKADGGEFLPEWDLTLDGNAPEPSFFVDKDGMKMSIYASGKLLKSQNNQTVYQLAEPLIEHIFDGIYPGYYNPPGEVTEYPFLLNTDQVSHFSCFVFAGYKEWGAIPLRDAVQAEVERLQPEPLFKCAQLPRFVRATLTYQKHANRTNLHLLAHIPEHRTLNGDVIEEDLTVPAMTVQVKTASGKAFSEPEHQALNCRRKGEYLEVEVPQFTGYALIALE